jgi:PhnB protein
MEIHPYLFYEGRCEEAINFYRTAIGAESLMVMRFKDSPEPMDHGDPDKVMHARLRVGDTTLLVSDGHCTGEPDFKGIALSLTVTTEADAERLFKGLCDGGQVQMPLAKTFFSPKFGMVTDRFGVMWMVYVTAV